MPTRRNAPSGLPGNFIYQIVEDAHHDLWIAIKDAGLARWNRATRHASRSTATIPPIRLARERRARTVLVDHAGPGLGRHAATPASTSWIRPPGRIEHLRHDPANPDSLVR